VEVARAAVQTGKERPSHRVRAVVQKPNIQVIAGRAVQVRWAIMQRVLAADVVVLDGRIQVRHDYSRNTARIQHSEALREQATSLGQKNMLEKMGRIHRRECTLGPRQWSPQIVDKDISRPRHRKRVPGKNAEPAQYLPQLGVLRDLCVKGPVHIQP